MPTSSIDFVWYAFNGAILLLMFFARNDLKEIKFDIRAARTKADKTELDFATLKSACDERHKRMDYEIADIKTKVADK